MWEPLYIYIYVYIQRERERERERGREREITQSLYTACRPRFHAAEQYGLYYNYDIIIIINIIAIIIVL